MSGTNSRSVWLAASAGVLTLLFLADRFGILPGASDEKTGSDAGARSRYLARAAEAAEDEAMIARADEWRRAEERARAEWDRVRVGLIRGQTAELCETRFREIVLGAMQDIRLVSPARINYVRDGAAAAAAGAIRPLRLSVEFDAPTHRDAYAIIDRLENLPDARAKIELLRIEGPGRIQMPRQVRVVMSLGAVALVGEGGA